MGLEYDTGSSKTGVSCNGRGFQLEKKRRDNESDTKIMIMSKYDYARSEW